VFKAAIQSFDQLANPMRVNNFATGIRELARIMLHDFASDKDIKVCEWYVEETNLAGQVVISRAQRIRYAVHAGLPEEFVQDTLGIDLQQTISTFNALNSQLSKLTHVTPETFDLDEQAADALAQQALDTLISLFTTIDDCRSAVHEAVEISAKNALTDEMLDGTVEALDEIATHYYVDEVHIDNLKLESLGAEEIVFKASGTVDCTLQYGSDSDVASDIGMRVDDNYPLTCEFVADVTAPLDLTVRELYVDNSSFYE
jgi:hypothetical protein